MAHYDPATGAVVARIVYDGLGFAGKTSMLRKVHELFTLARVGEVVTPTEAKGRTLYFDWLELRAGMIGDYPLQVHLLSVPGQWVYAQRRWLLLHESDAIVTVVDSTPEGVGRGQLGLRFLKEVLTSFGPDAPPLLVQANKQDLPGALRAEELRQAMNISPEIPVYETVVPTGEGVRAMLVRSLQMARERILSRLDGRPLTELPPLLQGPEEIYEAMRSAETERGDHLEGELLAEQVLESLEPNS